MCFLLNMNLKLHNEIKQTIIDVNESIQSLKDSMSDKEVNINKLKMNNNDESKDKNVSIIKEDDKNHTPDINCWANIAKSA